MNRPLFVSLDGPKGAGKTTLLEAVTKVLRADNKKVIRLCESKSDPYRGETMALVNKLVRNLTRDLELEVCERLADSRTWISEHVLAKQPPGSIIVANQGAEQGELGFHVGIMRDEDVRGVEAGLGRGKQVQF